MAKAAGYSGTPLAKKLGYKPGIHVRIINAPENYPELLEPLPENVSFTNSKSGKKFLLHFFTTKLNELYKQLPVLKKEMEVNGMLWISWPKRSSGVKTDITEDLIRECAISNGLVDIKVCAIDEVWAGLKLVIPVKERGL